MKPAQSQICGCCGRRRACGIGIQNESYAVLGGAEKLFNVDLIPGNPPSPTDVIRGLFALVCQIEKQASAKV